MSNFSRHTLRQANARFILLTVLLSLALLFLLSYHRTEPLETHTLVALTAFVVLAVLSELYPLTVPFGNATLGFSGTIYWALIVLFDPFYSGLGAFISFIIAEALRKRHLSKALFNSVQVGLSATLACLIFIYINGASGMANNLRFFMAFSVAAMTYWIINTWFVCIAVWILYGNPPARFWQANFQWSIVYELTSAPVALGLVFSYQKLGIIGLLLLTLPILMVRLAYRQYIELKKTYRETVRTLVKIIEMHDPYTAGHSDRVATYTRRLCEVLRLSPGRTERIELAALLHDLGKIHLDLSNIIRKAGKLNEEERRLIKLHSVVSADLANQVSYFKGEIEGMIRHHHENWDGSGYPHGLRGEQIPIGSRIILIADAFDAMTTSRVYRDAFDLNRVKGEFRRFAGTQFDPELVPIFLDHVVGDGNSIIRQPMDEPLEGQRARLETLEASTASKVRDIASRVLR